MFIFTNQIYLLNMTEDKAKILEEKIRKFSSYQNENNESNMVIYENDFEENSDIKDLSEKSDFSIERIKNEGIYVPRRQEILIEDEI